MKGRAAAARGSLLAPAATLLVAALVAGLGLAGCDGGPRDTAPSADAPVAAAATRVLRRGNGPEPDSLDPQLARSDSAGQILRDAYEGLATLDRSAQPAPGVAERWEQSADGLTWTFHLRPAARWSNGDPVTARDFVAAWRRLVDPRTGSQYAQMLEPVANAAEIVAGRAPVESLGVAAPDDATLVVRLRAPTPYFAGLVAHWSTFPVHGGAAPARPGDAVSNGAFTIADWVVGSHVAARRNPRYWNDAATRIDEVRYVHTNDANDEYSRFRAGELDVTYALPQQPLERLKKAHGDALHVGPQLAVYYYGVNMARAPLGRSRELRQALSMTVDRDRLVASVTGLGELPAWSWIPPGVANYAPQRAAWASLPYERRVEEARRLYAAAGYSPANPLRVELRYPTGPTHERIALAVGAMWKSALGVETRLVAEEFKSMLQTVQRGETELFRASWVGDYNDAHTFAQLMQSGFGINMPGYRSAAYDAHLAAAAREPDPAKRAAALEAAERQLLEDAPVIPLYFLVNKRLVAPHVQGWSDNVMNVVYSKDLAVAP